MSVWRDSRVFRVKMENKEEGLWCKHFCSFDIVAGNVRDACDYADKISKATYPDTETRPEEVITLSDEVYFPLDLKPS